MITPSNGGALEAWEREASLPLEGWDFSRLDGRWVEEHPDWRYDDLARGAMSRAVSVLDIGTGGGERLERFAERFPARVVATEDVPSSVRLAARRLRPLGVHVLRHRGALDQQLPFADRSFDLVLCRHAAYSASEVARVLESGGALLTQQVAGTNLEDLSAEFGVEQPWRFWRLVYARAAVEKAGLRVTDAREWEGALEFLDVGALVAYLSMVPWTVPGFSVARDRRHLERLDAKLAGGGRLVFSQRRFLLAATKP